MSSCNCGTPPDRRDFGKGFKGKDLEEEEGAIRTQPAIDLSSFTPA